MFEFLKTRPKEDLPRIMVTRNGNDTDVPVALVIGHSEKDQGAINYLGETEYLFNKRISRKIARKLNDRKVGSVIVKRPPMGSYTEQVRFVLNELRLIKPTLSVHLHFNSSEGKVRGCEVLVLDGDKRAKLAADYITDFFNHEWKFRERGDDGTQIIGRGERGFHMLSAMSSANITPVLIEPCFGSWRNKESIVVFEREDQYVDALPDVLNNPISMYQNRSCLMVSKILLSAILLGRKLI